MKYVIILVAWVCCGLFTGAAINADWRREFHWQDEVRTRHDCAFAFGLGILGGPIALPASAVISGFYYSGFSFSCSVDH